MRPNREFTFPNMDAAKGFVQGVQYANDNSLRILTYEEIPGGQARVLVHDADLEEGEVKFTSPTRTAFIQVHENLVSTYELEVPADYTPEQAEEMFEQMDREDRELLNYEVEESFWQAEEIETDIDEENLSLDDWRGEVCTHLRDYGYGALADEVGGFSDKAIQQWRDDFPDADEAAGAIVESTEKEES